MKKRKFFSLALLWVVLQGSIALAQTQIGNTIEGESSFSYAGFSVSMSADGQRLVIGSPFNGDNGTQAGSASVYEWDGMDWVQMGQDLDGSFGGDLFGIEVLMSASGDRIAVSANQAFEFSVGYAKVYEWNGMDWEQVGATFSGSGPGASMGSGMAFSDNGSRFAVSSTFDGGGGGNSLSWIKVYDDVDGSWVQVGSTIFSEESNDAMGSALAFTDDGSQLAVGTRLWDEPGNASGRLQVFTWANNDWEQMGQSIIGVGVSDQLGADVSISKGGSRIAATAERYDEDGLTDVGMVRIFEWDGTGWAQLGQNIVGHHDMEHFGTSIDMSGDGDRVVVGAVWSKEQDLTKGSATVYDLVDGNWVQAGMRIYGDMPGDECGSGVSISDDGNWIAVGAYYNDAAGFDAGHVRVFQVPSAVVSVESLSVEEGFDVFPNPSKGVYHFPENQYERLEVFNANGQLVATQIGQPELIDLSFLSPGVYWVEFSNDQGLSRGYKKKLVRY